MYIKNEQMVGPLFILCALALTPITLPLFALAIGGFVLCNTFHMRGFYCMLGAIGLLTIWEFAFSPPETPLWYLGLYVSYGLTFFVTAFSMKHAAQSSQSLLSQWEARGESLLHREEEMRELQAQSGEAQVAQQEKIEALQKQIEESASDHSSVLVLNEVLRNTAARHLADCETAQGALQATQVRYGLMMEHQEALEGDLERLQDTSHLAAEQKRLSDALHTAQMDKEQTHLINETLARLHAQEHLKAKVAVDQLEEQKALALLSQEERIRMQMQLEQEREKVSFALTQVEEQKTLLVALQQEREKVSFALTQVEEQKTLLVALQQELACVQAESLVQPVAPIIDLSVSHETVKCLEERVKALTQSEILYRQLKAQFEEKNKVLHQVRKELFHAETALETLKMDKDAQENVVAYSAFPEIVDELTLLDGECARLQEENEELHRLVTALNLLPPTLTSKKEKLGKHNFLQASLFEV